MLFKAVLRVLSGVFDHQPVSADLSKYRRCRDRHRARVALHNRLAGDIELRLAVAVYDREIGRDIKLLYGALHREHRRVENVYLLDLLDARPRDGASDRLGQDNVEQLLALFFGELL